MVVLFVCVARGATDTKEAEIDAIFNLFLLYLHVKKGCAQREKCKMRRFRIEQFFAFSRMFRVFLKIQKKNSLSLLRSSSLLF